MTYPDFERKKGVRKVLWKERQAKALHLRKLGLTYEEIAVQCGYASRGAAAEAVKKVLDDLVQEPAEDVRRLEVERLEELWHVAFAMATNGHLQALDRCLKIMERRARLLGLDAPERVEIESALRAEAAKYGLTGDEMVAAAEEILRGV